ncbi:MAG: hypothetical protein MPW15_15675 [Candidatus Manganitrophus sp.]|nr:hypothetical protein [Candidatus Manganitrophus sp.]
MRSIYKKTSLAMAGVLLSAGFAMAQTTTVNFASPTCNSAATCGLAGGTNRLTEVSGDNFFFQEADCHQRAAAEPYDRSEQAGSSHRFGF